MEALGTGLILAAVASGFGVAYKEPRFFLQIFSPLFLTFAAAAVLYMTFAMGYQYGVTAVTTHIRGKGSIVNLDNFDWTPPFGNNPILMMVTLFAVFACLMLMKWIATQAIESRKSEK